MLRIWITTIQPKICSLKADIAASETSAISSINKTANRHISTIKSEIENANTVLTQIDNCKSIPTDVLATINNTTVSLTSTVSTTLETFEDNITEFVDNQQQAFRQWVTQVLNGNNLMAVKDFATTQHEMEQEIAHLKAER